MAKFGRYRFMKLIPLPYKASSCRQKNEAYENEGGGDSQRPVYYADRIALTTCVTSNTSDTSNAGGDKVEMVIMQNFPES